MIIYPSILDYQRAIQGPVGSFTTLQNLRPLLDVKNRPRYVAGNRAVIFRVVFCNKEYALKCYTSHSKHNFEHYKKLSQALRDKPFSLFAPFDFLESELSVQNSEGVTLKYSVVLMPWLEGELLSSLVSRLCYLGKCDKLRHLAALFCEMAIKLLESGYTHGDLKPDNIFVEPSGNLRLIDLDAVGFSSVYGTPQNELGTLWYQHPKGRGSCISSHQDDYSIAMIASSLYLLAREPHLLERETNGENLIFDTRNIMHSSNPQIAAAISSAEGDEPLQQLIQMLSFPSYRLPGLLRVLKQSAGVFQNYLSTEDIATIYEDVMPETYRRVAVRSGSKWAYINLEDKTRTLFIYDEAQPFSCQVATARRGKKWYVLGLNFKPLFYVECSTMKPYRDGVAIITRDGLFGAIDAKGVTVVECVASTLLELKNYMQNFNKQ